MPRINELVTGFVLTCWDEPGRDGRLVDIVERLPGTIYGEPGFVIVTQDGKKRYASCRQLHPWFPPGIEELDQLLWNLKNTE